MIRTFEIENQEIDKKDPWSGILSAVAWAVRSTYHTTLQSTPGQLVFGRDMIWNTTHIANWQYIKQRKQTLINKNNKRENNKQIDYDFPVGELVTKIKAGTLKMEQHTREWYGNNTKRTCRRKVKCKTSLSLH
jgi:hypothetical protein